MGGPIPAEREFAFPDALSPHDPRPHRVRLLPPELMPQVPPAFEKAWTRDRTKKKGRPVYWTGIDWRDLLRTELALPGALTPGNQGKEDTCFGFAVAHALRANIAIQRKTDIGMPNPFFIWAAARERVKRLGPGHPNYLLEALSVVNNYRTPKGRSPSFREVQGGSFLRALPRHALEFRASQPKAGVTHKLQSIVDLGSWLGDWSAWLHAYGPIVVNMTVDRERYDAVTPRNPVLTGYRGGMAFDGELTTKYGGHDVVVVGYKPVTDPRYPDSFVFMNSYGTAWGDGGFAYVSVDEAQKCFRRGYGLLFREQLGYTREGMPAPQFPSRLAKPPQSPLEESPRRPDAPRGKSSRRPAGKSPRAPRRT